MQIKDTMRGKTEFHELHKGRINMFVCGPTVYDIPHVGNSRVYVFFDMVAKYLRARGYSVFYLQNITDIDDKIINRAAEEGSDYRDISERYYSLYMDIMKKLGIDSVNIYARATLYLDEIISQIQRLQDLGYVYATDDGLYYRIRKFADYGKLSGQDIDHIEAGARVEVNENKEDPGDFAVWKFRKPGEPYWNSPWGEGRPGWHIEDTAITECHFGPSYDIHGGGSDLIFPHHEAEIAQMRAISGLPSLASVWMHVGMLNINGNKMSKSLKNFITIDQVMRSHSREEIRFYFLNSGYRSTMIFSDAALKESSETLKRIQTTYDKLVIKAGGRASLYTDLQGIIRKLQGMMDNDFDAREFFAEIMKMTTEINRGIDSMDAESAGSYLGIFNWMNSFMGILKEKSEEGIPVKLVDDLISLRNQMRGEKMFTVSDAIREILFRNGIILEDREGVTEWRRS
ncbi:MAG: cysteine--tRNA ligase [Candidatus Thermoplasmatota archaeon]|jgi:cysteinyl-tRNA synthetase|nr:cysteine--tRNA ligase [Candidatus Thermoplasmatota archaeon]